MMILWMCLLALEFDAPVAPPPPPSKQEIADVVGVVRDKRARADRTWFDDVHRLCKEDEKCYAAVFRGLGDVAVKQQVAISPADDKH